MERISFCDYLKDYLELEEISVKEFAKNLDINYSQLSQVLNKKRELSFELMQKISFVTPFKLEEIVNMETNYQLEKQILKEIAEHGDTVEAYVSRYKYKELELYDSRIVLKHKEDKLQVIKDIMQYLRISSPYIKKENNVFFKSKHDKTELVNIWLEKCFRETKDQEIGNYQREKIESIIDKIKQIAKGEKFSKSQLQKLFNQSGIYLCIVEDLPGSKIRGAFKVQDTKPAIYLTYKHRRPADLYFALLHELAHCKTDFNSAKAKVYISIETSMLKEIDYSEKLADQKAFDWMVPDAIFDRIKDNFNDQLLTKYIEEYDLIPMFLVYRLAHEKLIKYNSYWYQTYNPVIVIE